jgi:hypothetical protein
MTAPNILAVYQLANTLDRANGMAWYANAKNIALDLCRKYRNISLVQAAGVIAALSPRNKWERNVADAENLIRVFSIDPESVDSVKVCTFGANKAKAIRILQENPQSEGEVLAILSGPKLQEFYCCIAGWSTEVCIDGHAYSIWAGDRITLANVPSIGKKLRATIKADYVAAAQEAGITAYEMQAVTWCAWRRLHGVER